MVTSLDILGRMEMVMMESIEVLGIVSKINRGDRILEMGSALDMILCNMFFQET